VRAVLISTYDMGRQPFGLASPAAWLREAGVEVRCADVGKERLPEEAVREADLVAFFLPMHTATRLALPVIERVRALNPGARLAAYGLYAPLNADAARAGRRRRARRRVRGGPRPPRSIGDGRALRRHDPAPRFPDARPGRAAAALALRDARDRRGARIAGYTEASRGCKHFCRHCPVVPVYEGRFRIVPPEVVIADARAQVAAGARHITFGDPDFLNGPRHAVAVIERLARECPGVSYDVTIKIEHLLKHADLLPLLRDTGCAFVTSAVESVDDAVLARLAKGHTRADFERVVELCAQAGVPLVPTFVAFTPWTTLETYCDLLQAIDRLGLVDHVAPIQLAIRLLVPEGSRLLELQEVRALTRGFDAASLTYRWVHPDPRVDALQARLAALAGARIDAGREEVFGCAWVAAHETAGIDAVRRPPPLVRATIPYLNEPWYC
jgi:radical SAM superfamily enzyme YgiQ (UPF0313 family)